MRRSARGSLLFWSPPISGNVLEFGREREQSGTEYGEYLKKSEPCTMGTNRFQYDFTTFMGKRDMLIENMPKGFTILLSELNL